MFAVGCSRVITKTGGVCVCVGKHGVEKKRKKKKRKRNGEEKDNRKKVRAVVLSGRGGASF